MVFYRIELDTFLESYDFSEKTIVPFCTSASDSIGNSLHIFSELAANAVIAEGLTANDSADIEPWLNSLDTVNSSRAARTSSKLF